MRIVELPPALSPNGAFALAALVSRRDVMQIGYSVWLGDNYDFNGAAPPESYQLLATGSRFAQRAILTEDYPTDTQTLDFDTRLRVVLDAPDNQLDTQTATNGLANDLLVFLGGEILSVVGVELTGVGSYALQVARERFGTTRGAHESGEAAYIIYRAALLPLVHAAFLPGMDVTFKVPVASGRFSDAVEDVEPVTFSVAGSSQALPPPNLRVNRDARNPVYWGAYPLVIEWSPPEARRMIAGERAKTRTRVEIVGVGDVVLWSKLTYKSRMTIMPARLAAILGVETEFDVRLATDVLSNEFHLVSTPVTLHIKPALGAVPDWILAIIIPLPP